MEYTVLIQEHDSGGFIASVPALPGCQGHGATEDDALREIRANIEEFLRKTKIARISVEGNGKLPEDPWDEVIGMFEDDETFDDFQKEIRKYRHRKALKLNSSSIFPSSLFTTSVINRTALS